MGTEAHAPEYIATPLALGEPRDVVAPICFHCSQPIPRKVHIAARVNGTDRPVCCYGCRAVAEMIGGAGLSDYYRFRTAPAARVDESRQRDEWAPYDQPQLLEQFSRVEPDGTRSAALVLDGMGCAACGWLIHRMLMSESGVCSANVNVATARMRVQWRPQQIAFSRILQRLAELGYRPHAVSYRALADRMRDERRAALKRLGVAGLGMMQVMMFAVALYASHFAHADAMDPQIRTYLRYVSLLCATPVLFYSGLPFLLNAWRAVRVRAVVMDVPVSAALILAYGASLWNTVRHTGHVYFDSVTMFVFFLSVGRYVEMMARQRSGDVSDALARLLPVTAHRTKGGMTDSVTMEDVPVTSLTVGDQVIVRSGETVPADGVIVEGASRLDESMLTGEAQAVSRGVGTQVVAGTTNLSAPLRVRVTAIGQATVLSGIVRLLHSADYDKSPQATAANRAAAWFLSRVLLGAAGVAAAWLWIDPSRAFEATLAVLVATCPCALSLATPTALAAATAALARRGVLITSASALENLAGVTRVVFDKTGTLTVGRPSIDGCVACESMSSQDCTRIAIALEQGSEHPIARAFSQLDQVPNATDVLVAAGEGIEGSVEGRRYRIGRRDYAAQLRTAQHGGNVMQDDVDDTCIYLGDEQRELGSFSLIDAPRRDAVDAVAALRKRGAGTEILSGDAWVAVARTARFCGIDCFTARQTPAQKLAHVRELIDNGERVAMVGDGINDAPVLKGASVSIAMGAASALAQVSADIILIGNRLAALPEALDVARRTQRIVKQNLWWAAGYNLLALPLAALGWVPPWLAALGMSFSSMVVVLNALRLSPRAHRQVATVR